MSNTIILYHVAVLQGGETFEAAQEFWRQRWGQADWVIPHAEGSADVIEWDDAVSEEQDMGGDSPYPLSTPEYRIGTPGHIVREHSFIPGVKGVLLRKEYNTAYKFIREQKE